MTPTPSTAGGENPLLEAAAMRGLDGFEAKWLELLGQPPEAAVFLSALDSLDVGDLRELALPLLTLLLESCCERNAHGDTLAVVERLSPLRPRKIDLMEVARAAVAAEFGSEPWCDLFVELAGFQGTDVDSAVERFNQLRRLLPGSPVYHGTGWGEGVVTEADYSERTIVIRFRSDDRERSMPISTGLDVLRPLDREDLRGRLMVDADGLKRDSDEDPAALIRAVARLTKGRCTAKEVKQWLSGSVIADSAWAGWWKKAKVAAANDAWLIVENPARPTFIVRRRPLSAADAVGEALKRARDMTACLEVARGPLALDPEPEVRDRILEGLTARLEKGEGRAEERVEAALMLARHGSGDVAGAGATIAALIDGGLSFGELASRLSPAAMRKDALDALQAARPGLWSDAVIGDLGAVPATLLDAVVEKLLAEGRGSALANRLKIFLLTPSRQPEAVMRLCRLWALGGLDGIEGSPDLNDVFMGMLHLAETHAPRADRNDKDSKVIMKTLAELLAHRRAKLFARFCKDSTRSEMERAMGVIARCKTMPREILGPLQEGCHERFPDLVPTDDTPFWEGNAILCSMVGLKRRHEEYRVLLAEKIPENSEVIGKAAAFGDLSENYEWTAAIEQQRQLTEKAAAMEAELKLARAIEDEELPVDLVCPGKRVGYEQDGVDKWVVILGPWDTGEGVVSYRAPLAAGMLGKKAGDQALLELPSGAITVTVKSVDPAL